MVLLGVHDGAVSCVGCDGVLLVYIPLAATDGRDRAKPILCKYERVYLYNRLPLDWDSLIKRYNNATVRLFGGHRLWPRWKTLSPLRNADNNNRADDSRCV